MIHHFEVFFSHIYRIQPHKWADGLWRTVIDGELLIITLSICIPFSTTKSHHSFWLKMWPDTGIQHPNHIISYDLWPTKPFFNIQITSKSLIFHGIQLNLMWPTKPKPCSPTCRPLHFASQAPSHSQLRSPESPGPVTGGTMGCTWEIHGLHLWMVDFLAEIAVLIYQAGCTLQFSEAMHWCSECEMFSMVGFMWLH